MVVLKELFLTVYTLGGCGGLERTPTLDCPYRLEKSPTMPTAIEALNFNHFKTDLHYLFFNNHLYMHLLIFPIGPISSFQTNAIAMALCPLLCRHQMVHCSSTKTEGIQSSREACPWHGAHLNSTLKPLQNLQAKSP